MLKKTVAMQIDYIIKKSHRRSMSIHIDENNKVVVKAPVGTPTYVAEEFIREKKDWIVNQLERIENQTQLAQSLGMLTKQDIKNIKKKAKSLIPQRVEHYAKMSGITYNKITIRLQKSRWGSCSAEGNLNFNCLLALMPMEILDSVVVHELCHRHHMDHSKEFYTEVLTLFPEYKRCNKWLKENGPAYFRRIPEED